MSKLKELLSKSNCQALIIISEISCRYFTHFNSDFGYIVVCNDFIRYYTDKRYYDEALKHLDIEVKLVTSQNVIAIINEDIKPYSKVGIDESNVYYNQYKSLTNDIKADIVNIGNIVQDTRAIKDADDLLLIETAIDIADSALDKVLGSIVEGITEKELVYELESQMIRNGADEKSFDTIVAFKENSAYPHWHSSDRKLAYGDNILMDFGATYKGYHSDMTRVVSFGKASEEFKEIYNIVLEANQIAIDSAKAGMTAHNLDDIARQYITDKGYGKQFSHALGHGVGIEIHESPRLAQGEETALCKGMVFSIEPGIYILDKYGVRIEDLVFLLDNKAYQLTKSEKKLIEL